MCVGIWVRDMICVNHVLREGDVICPKGCTHRLAIMRTDAKSVQYVPGPV